MSVDITLSWWLAIVPEICLTVLLFIVLLYYRIAGKDNMRQTGVFTAWGAFIILLITLGMWAFFNEPSATPELVWGGMIRHDAVTLVFRVMFLVALMVTALVSVEVESLQSSEYYGLLVAATIGFSLMAAGADLIMIYLALETASISSYVLAGYHTKDKRSSEAGMKYFVYGAFATGIMLYGMSLIYGLTTHTNLYVIGDILSGNTTSHLSEVSRAIVRDTAFSGGSLTTEANGVLLLAAVMVIVGFGYKVSAFPFHFWTPDVYDGAPTPFTGFVSTASKAAGFAIFIRVFSAGVLGEASFSNPWWAVLVAMSIITMAYGNFVAIFQTNIKRLLAYSSIAQAGYAMIGLITFSQDGTGAGATMFYLLMYVFTNIAAFGVIILVSKVTGSEELKDYSGLSRRSPYLALAMMLAILSLGGIPPTAGFLGKFFLFKAAVDAGLWWLALIGILLAFVALYYYLNVIKYMYLYRSEEEDQAIPVSRAAQVGLAFSVFFIILLGVYAGPAIDWTNQAATAFFPG
ncbi:MAG: NADH-quinone oxidoreductase subunit N [Chloroflexota bacterium]